MSIKTENLAILLTDIAGFTEATVKQSRLDNARLLAAHNRILFPILRRYKGRHVKSIGDALLLVFRSPTDAMLCAMAMQDALYEYNRNTPKEQQIHIRIAASLGEVRVTRSDVFGEAVNTTSRIESITPPDEIYLSEAVYMAMNKAEVPSQEVGWRELKGLSGPIRIFNIPRFSVPRLVPQDVMAAEDMSDLVYPYGGAHLSGRTTEGRVFGQLDMPGLFSGRVAKVLLAALILVPGVLLAVNYGGQLFSGRGGDRVVTASQTAPAAAPESPRYQPEFKTGSTRAAASAPPPTPVAATRTTTTAGRQYQQEFSLGSGSAATATTASAYSRISDAKKAYRAEKLSKADYRKVVEDLEQQMRREIDQAKADYKADKIDKKTYKQRIEEIEKRYE